jgi:sortase B
MKRFLYYALLGVFSVTFLVSVYFIGDYYLEAMTVQSGYDALSNIVEQNKDKDDPQRDPILFVPPVIEGGTPTQPEDVQDSTQPEETGTAILPEYADLYLMNTDLVGWIRIEDTQINYPVMQTPDSVDFYLKRDFEKASSQSGCIYVREQCDVFAPSDNLTIYGHNMRNGTMFHDLAKFRSKSFWETHRTFTFDTIIAHHTYEIVAVFTTTASVGKGFAYHQFVNAQDEADFDRFINTAKKLALYETGVTATYGDKLITLSTCEYSQVNGRLVVLAKRVTEG